MYVFINYPVTINCTSCWKGFTPSWLGGVILYPQKKEWLKTAGFEPTISAFSFRYTPLEETFFIHSATYTRNIKLSALIKTGTAGSAIKLKLVLTEILQQFDIFINKSSYFLTKSVNNLQKHNTADCEVSYINFINSVWRDSFTFKMAECLSLACCSTFAQYYLLRLSD